MIKECAECGLPFLSAYGSTICSPVCRKARAKRRSRLAWGFCTQRDKGGTGSIIKECAICGEPFPAPGTDKVCEGACRRSFRIAGKAAYRAANKEKIREANAVYKAAHRERDRVSNAAKNAVYRAANKEKIREQRARQRAEKKATDQLCQVLSLAAAVNGEEVPV